MDFSNGHRTQTESGRTTKNNHSGACGFPSTAHREAKPIPLRFRNLIYESIDMKTKIAINGACGRMGQRLVALANEDPELQLITAVDWPKHPNQGKDAGDLAGVGAIGVPVTGTLPPAAMPDVAIDFSIPEGT